MTIELWTGFVVGILGSLHCIGMCGPIAAALPTGFTSRKRLIVSRLLYNAGRTVTYGVMGAICGMIGQTIAMAGLQRGLSVAAGIVILLAVLLPSKWLRRLIPTAAVASLTSRVKKIWGRMFQSGSLGALFTIGLLNGLLPCGFLYVGLAAAAATGSVVNATLYMLLFGLGTMPSLLAVSLFGPMLGQNVRRRLRGLLPVGAIVLGLLLVLRGMSLGIPYISPNLDSPKAPGTETHSCCH